MSEQDEQANVRRLGRKDRKRRLDTRGPLFPPEEVIPPAPPPLPPAAVEAEAEDAAPPIEKAAASKPAAGRFPPLEFETKEAPEPTPQSAPVRRRNTCLPNLITLIFALGTVAVIAVVAIITANPYAPINPFPPFTPIPLIITATFLPPTITPLPTEGPTPTFTPIPLDTQGQPLPDYAFTLSNNGSTPVYIPNANDQGCNWSSIAGSVTDTAGSALNGYGIHITGEGVDSVVFSGAALTFGPGGFELFLNGTPQEKTYSVQLLSPQGVPFSDVYTISTRSACDQNVAIVTFVQKSA